MMEKEQARQISALAWCQEKTSSIQMNVDLADEFARILMASIGDAEAPLKARVQELEAVNAELRDKALDVISAWLVIQGREGADEAILKAHPLYEYMETLRVLCVGHPEGSMN